MSSEDAYNGKGSSGHLPAAGSTTDLGPVNQQKIEPDDSVAMGQVIDGRYRIVKKLGEGGMGEVYAAEHIHIAQRVAIKLLRPEVTSNPEAVQRFQQEARSASSTKHQNIIGIVDAGRLADGRYYLCMELLDGAPLNDILQEGPLDPDRALDILIQSCHGLAAAHAKGIVHRDMKPENIFITRDPHSLKDIPKLLDFGIAKVSGTDGDNNLTRTGTIFGTPFYMAPEQALGQGIDHRADVYAMGVIMYEMFCGSVPFQGESFMGILTKHITAKPESPTQRAMRHGRSLPPGIEGIINRAMEKEAGDRFQNMQELVAALVNVRQQLIGPGMSAYMEAHRPSASIDAVGYGGPSGAVPAVHPSGAQPAVTPSGAMPAVARGPSSSVPAAHIGSGQGPAYGQYGPGSGGYRPGESADMGAPRKSKVGLIAAIVVVLAVVGGIVGFVVVSGGEGDEVADNTTDNNNVTDPGNNGTDTDPTTDPETVIKDPDNGTKDPDSSTGDPDKQGTDSTPDGKDPDNTTVLTPDPPKPIVVFVSSTPAKATVMRDGKKLGRTPLKVKVTPGENVELTLSKKRYRDATITLDGKKDIAEVRLSRRGSSSSNNSSPGDQTTGNDNDNDNGSTGDDGDNGDGTGSLGLDLED